MDLTPFVASCVVSSNEHGPQELRAVIPRTLYDAFRIYDAPGTLHIALNDGAGKLWTGRLEEPGLRAGAGGSLEINALGYWRALTDIPYTAVWSTTNLSAFKPILAQVAGYMPDRYEFTTDTWLEIALQKGATYGNLTDTAALYIRTPSAGARSFIGVAFDFAVNLPNNWNFDCVALNTAFGSQVTILTITSAGALITRAGNFTFTARDVIAFRVYNNTGANSTPAGETGTNYVRITNVRAVTTTTNRVSTSSGGAFGPGAVTITPGTMANIYVGQILQIGVATIIGESVVVTAVTATTFSCTVVGAYGAGTPIAGHIVYANEIINDLISTVSTANSTQLQSTTALVTSPSRDIVDATYADQLPSEIATALALTGNSSNLLYEVGVDTERRLYFRQQSSRAQAWYVDVEDLQLNRSLDGLTNSAYAVYEDASSFPLRSATSSNAPSVLRYGVTRRLAVDVDTTSSTYATAVRDATIAAGALVQPRATFTVRAVYNVNSARSPLAYVQAGDTLTIRNLPPTASSAIDSIRTFRITRTEYDAIADALTIEPEAPATTLDALVGGQV